MMAPNSQPSYTYDLERIVLRSTTAYEISSLKVLRVESEAWELVLWIIYEELICLSLHLALRKKSYNKLEFEHEPTFATGSASSAEYMNEEFALMLKATRKRF